MKNLLWHLFPGIARLKSSTSVRIVESPEVIHKSCFLYYSTGSPEAVGGAQCLFSVMIQVKYACAEDLRGSGVQSREALLQLAFTFWTASCWKSLFVQRWNSCRISAKLIFSHQESRSSTFHEWFKSSWLLRASLLPPKGMFDPFLLSAIWLAALQSWLLQVSNH